MSIKAGRAKRAIRRRASKAWSRSAVAEALESRTLLSTVYVDAHAPGSTQDGTSWATAYLDLQPALTAAVSGTEIRVADGTYKPTGGTDRTISFVLENGVSLMGGYAGYGAPDPDARDVTANQTVLSGDIGSVGSSTDNSYHVVVGSGTDSTAVLDGFTITAGYANGSSTNLFGGGMFSSAGSPTVSNCTFNENLAASGYGGAMYNDISSPTLTNCTFSRNLANYGYGGAMYNSSSSPTLSNCTFSSNWAGPSGGGGGMYNSSSSPTLTNCTFSRNTAGSSYGGGMYNSSSSPTLTNCTFIANGAGISAGGMYNSSSSPTLTNCTFAGNSAPSGGGMFNGSSSATLTNCIFSGNSAIDPDFGGGGIYNNASPSPTLINCTFSGNTAPSTGGGMYNNGSSPTVTNCIIWGCGNTPVKNTSGTSIITYSDIQGGYSGAGNFDADPQFLRSPWTGPDGAFFGTADDDYGDLRLRIGSRALDMGDSSAIPAGVTTDVASNPRIQNGTVDMGAYEGAFTGPAPKMIYVDLNAPGANNGTSWNDAFSSLAMAILAGNDGDTIRIADGTYRPTTGTDRTLTFALKNGISLYGGYAGYGAPNPDARDILAYPTILSGDIGVTGSNTDNSYKVLTAVATGSAMVVDGLTITQGIANGGIGGGMSDQCVTLLTLNSCTFIGNSAAYGGGMYNSSSSPTLTNCTFSGNSATSGNGGGMYNSSSSPMLTNCTFSGNSATSGNGGGMYNSSSSPMLTNCTFSGNSATSGGGMYTSSSSVTLTNCTFSGNSASSGGGMFNISSSIMLTNCVFSANTATSSSGGGGAMYNNSSSPTLINCMFSGNTANSRKGGGIYNDSSPTLTNCIVWGCGTIPIYNSLDTATITYSDIQGGYAGAGNISLDPQFIRSPWAGPDGVFGTADDDYGDLRLRSSSPALDTGSNSAIPSGITTDLASNPRIQNGTVDMGAYEGSFTAAAPKLIYVDGSAPGANNGSSWVDAFTSLASAILAVSDGDTIRIADGTYKPTIGTNRALSIALKSAVSVYGGYAGYGAPNPDARNIVAFPTILSGDIGGSGSYTDNSYHVVNAEGIGNATILDGVTIIYGYANGNGTDQGNGAGLLCRSTLLLTLTNCTFSGNRAVNGNGGGMYNATSSPTLIGCTFSGNSASSSGSHSNGGGGGMYNGSSSPTLINCVFTGNTTSSGDYSSYGGGGMYNATSSPTLINSTFSGNIAYGASFSSNGGGGMYNGTYSSPTLTNCTFNGNRASSGYGGGMYNISYSRPTLTNCAFTSNSDAGMSNYLSSPALTNCAFTSNSGGGMYNEYNSSPTLANCTFNGNTGGGMYNDGSYCSPTLTNCTFSGNSATSGGGIYNDSNGSLRLIHCIFIGNIASYGDGGGMYSSRASVTLSNCTFSGNSAYSRGGGMYSDSSGYSSTTLTNCIFIGNSATSNHGGGLYTHSDYSPTKLTNCTFSGNMTTSGNGGGLFYDSYTSASVINCLFSGNTASAGGGMYAYFQVLYNPLKLINCTFSGNTASSGMGAGMYNDSDAPLKLTNCIIWGSGSNPFYNNDRDSIPIVTYSDIQGGYSGVGNIDADPLFVDADGPDNTYGTADDDLRLQAGSPCFNTGSNAAIPAEVTTDLDGNARIIGAAVDMGAYERQVVLNATDNSFNTDGSVGPLLKLTFSNALDNSSVSVADLLVQQVLSGGGLGASFPVASVSYDPVTKSASFTLPVSTPDGNYRATLLAGSVSDTYGNVPAADYPFDFFILGGDANHDRVVDIHDLQALANNWGGTGKTFSQGDFDYDGDVDAADLTILARNWQTTLAQPSSPLPTTLTKTARRTATRVITLVD